MMGHMPPPAAVVHCDWGAQTRKRWMARAIRDGNGVVALATTLVGDTTTFLQRMRSEIQDNAGILIGFDFPIGIPAAYARQACVREFLPMLLALGTGEWKRFYDKCEKPGDISVYRPFYPQSCSEKGAATRQHLTEGLGLRWEELFRECERATETRGDACPLFWTLGGSQVGTAALTGWWEVVSPALRCANHSFAIWPFQGELAELLESRQTVIAETYPREAYSHLGLPPEWKGKRNQAKRCERSDELLRWATIRGVRCNEKLVDDITDGFGAGSDGEDRFDAVVGLFGMLEVVLGHRSDGLPDCELVRKVEGWILGQQPRHT